MSQEYVRLSIPENTYGQKHLLYAQMELLNSLKHFEEYKKLRKTELLAKIELKRKLEILSAHLKELDKILPESQIKIKSEKPLPFDFPEAKKDSEAVRKSMSLDAELEAIKRKLNHLQNIP